MRGASTTFFYDSSCLQCHPASPPIVPCAHAWFLLLADGCLHARRLFLRHPTSRRVCLRSLCLDITAIRASPRRYVGTINAQSIYYPLTIVYPARPRPFGAYWLPFPRDYMRFLVLKFGDSALKTCIGRSWVRRTSTTKQGSGGDLGGSPCANEHQLGHVLTGNTLLEMWGTLSAL